MVNRGLLTISDWIVFLESNAQMNTNLFILTGNILVVIAVAVIGLDIANIIGSFLAGLIYLTAFIIAFSVLLYASSRAKKYQRLSQKIILGKITDLKDIKKEYESFMKEI